MIKETDVKFVRETWDKANSCWQDIEYNGKEIGALHSYYKNILSPIEERYQRLVPEALVPKLDWWYHSEDDGYVFACFETLSEFLDFVNSNSLGKGV